MKFDVVLGNPPYQESDGGGTGDSARPIYHNFIRAIKQSNPDYMTLVIPARWMKGGRGLSGFRLEMMQDKSISQIHDFENAKELFPNNDIDGGVCYIVWDKNHNGLVDYYYKPEKESDVLYTKRELNSEHSDKVIRDYRQLSIIDKALRSGLDRFDTIVSTQNPYGIRSDLFNRPHNHEASDLRLVDTEGYLKIYGVKGNKGGAKRRVGYIKPDYISKSEGSVNAYKIFFSKAFSTNTTIPPKTITGYPGEVCTETFIEIGPFSSKVEVDNVSAYLSSKFLRALLFYNRHSLNISKSSFELIPLQDFTENSDIDWSKSIPEIDQQLYKKYGLNEDEIEFIETHVK